MITQLVVGTVLGVIQAIGYAGIFLLMAAESTLLPIPSEAVLPFAGYLVAQGSFDIIIVIAAATLGTITGALISYYLGKTVGKQIVEHYGKYFFVSKSDLSEAERLFEKHGEKIIFASRFIPVIRHLISLPAGIARMKRRKFILYTALGGLLWNSILVYCGVVLENNWSTLIQYGELIDLAVIAVIIIGAVWFVKKHLKKEKSH